MYGLEEKAKWLKSRDTTCAPLNVLPPGIRPTLVGSRPFFSPAALNRYGANSWLKSPSSVSEWSVQRLIEPEHSLRPVWNASWPWSPGTELTQPPFVLVAMYMSIWLIGAS